MPLNSEILKTQIWTQLQAKGFRTVDKTEFPGALDIKDVMDTLIDILIPYFVSNTTVQTNVNVVVATTGTAVAQSGTGVGTGIGTIS